MDAPFAPLFARLVAARDAALMRRHCKLRWAALGVLLVPALYALIMLWTCGTRTRARRGCR
jgi:hypothetical protein